MADAVVESLESQHRMGTFGFTQKNFALRRVQRKSAFTLIELLVVIAVITILAAMLLPALTRARSAADSAVCKSNLHQWALGLRTYLDENKAYPTDWLEIRGVTDDNRGWHARLEPYVGGRWPQWDSIKGGFHPANGVAVCPAYGRLPNARYDDGRIGTWGNTSGSYGYNGFGLQTWGLISGCGPGDHTLFAFSSPDPSTKEADVVNPSDMIAIGDSVLNADSLWQVRGNTALSALWTLGVEAFWPEMGLSIGNDLGDDPFLRSMSKQRHGERFNVLFCDGHCENLGIRSLFDLRHDEVARHWNRDNLPHREAFASWFGP